MKRILTKPIISIWTTLNHYYNGAASRVRSFKAWPMIITLFLAVIMLPLVLHFVIAPKVSTWLDSRLPEVRPVQTALIAAYPDKSVGVMDQTFYVPGNVGGKKRMLAVTLTGKTHISRSETIKAKAIICTNLGDSAKIYDIIILQSTTEKRFLFFFTRDNKTDQVICNPPAANPDHVESTV